MKKPLICGLFAFAVLASFAGTSVSDVSTRQLWPWSKKIAVTYALTTDAPVDLVVRVTRNGQTTELPSSALSGDVYGVAAGAKRTLYWDPTETYPDEELVTGVTIDLEPVMERRYMIVDFADGLANGASRISYTNDVIGTKTASAGGETWKLWDDYYKTNALVLRRCLPGTFLAGAAPNERNSYWDTIEKQHRVTLTRTFYIGVFEVTQEQWKKVCGSYPTCQFTDNRAMRPVEKVHFYLPRGGQHEKWPNDDISQAHAVDNGFYKTLRTMTGGMLLFDHPTEAQWEYAARAGTTTALYNGKNLTCAVSGTPTDAALTDIARYASASDPDPAIGGTAIVGSYQPNAWGLFDMLGNVFEWCMDRYESWESVADAVVDPVGPKTGGNRIRRGGAWNMYPSQNLNRPTCDARSNSTVGDNGSYQGFRVSVTLY